MGLPHLLVRAVGCRWLQLADEKTVGVFGSCDCGGKVILDVEAVSFLDE